MDLCDPSVASSVPVDPADLLSVDKFKMSQVLRNFMSNALKFTPNGGTIAVRACFIPDTVTDNDVGMKVNVQSTNDDLLRLSAKFMQSFRGKPPANRVVADIESGLLTAPENGKGGGGGGGSDRFNILMNGTQIQQGMLRVSIIDTGPGISAQNQQRLFKEIVQFNPEILQGTWVVEIICTFLDNHSLSRLLTYLFPLHILLIYFRRWWRFRLWIIHLQRDL